MNELHYFKNSYLEFKNLVFGNSSVETIPM
jgi:hypothetical protein